MKLLFILLIITAIQSCPANDQYCAACSGTVCQVCYNSFLTSSGKCQASTVVVDSCL